VEVREPSARYLVRRGYKQTDLGAIPEDWSVVPLGRLVSSVEYGSAAKSNAEGDIPVLRMGNLQDGKIDWDDLVFTNDAYEIKKYALSSGDVLFNRTNTIDLVGKTAIYQGARPAVFAGYLIRINTDKAVLDSKFLNYVLNAEFSKKHSAKVLSVAVGQANINGQKLKTYPIPFPPTKAEQEAIAEALSDADALIESLEQLITKKRNLKQGAMQELLTGKMRLPGFNREWGITNFGSIAEKIIGGGTPSRSNSDYWNGDVPWMTVKDFACHTPLGTLETITSEGLKSSASHLIPKNTLITSTRMALGKAVIFEVDVSINQDLKAIFPNKDMDTRFLYFWFQCNASRIAEMGSGSTVMGLSLGELKKIPFLKPPHQEQTAIATILSDMDAEITALETKLTKARHIKQGMMQELLTGRIRLV